MKNITGAGLHTRLAVVSAIHDASLLPNPTPAARIPRSGGAMALGGTLTRPEMPIDPPASMRTMDCQGPSRSTAMDRVRGLSSRRRVRFVVMLAAIVSLSLCVRPVWPACAAAGHHRARGRARRRRQPDRAVGPRSGGAKGNRRQRPPRPAHQCGICQGRAAIVPAARRGYRSRGGRKGQAAGQRRNRPGRDSRAAPDGPLAATGGPRQGLVRPHARTDCQTTRADRRAASQRSKKSSPTPSAKLKHWPPRATQPRASRR